MILRNRIRSYTRWPNDRALRIELAKTDIAAALFFARCPMAIPTDIMVRGNKAFDLLESEQVPMAKWEE